jgi:hypothetical protein
MMDDNFAKEIEKVLGISELKTVPKTNGKELSLSEQWRMKESIEAELGERILREAAKIRADYTLRESELRMDSARRLREALAQLRDETAARLREYDMLVARMGG